MTKKTLFDYNIFSGTTQYYEDNHIVPLLYWTDGVQKLIENKKMVSILKIVNDFILLLINKELVLEQHEKDMMQGFQVWYLAGNDRNIKLWCQADSGMPYRSESTIHCSPESVDFNSLKLFCTLYGNSPTKYVLMLNTEY